MTQQLSRTELREQYGLPYVNAYMQGPFEVVERVQAQVGDGWHIDFVMNRGPVPEGAIRIGQVRVRTSDPEFPVYSIRR